MSSISSPDNGDSSNLTALKRRKHAGNFENKNEKVLENRKETEKKKAPRTFADISGNRNIHKENTSNCIYKRKKGVERKKDKSVDQKNQISIKHFFKDNDSRLIGLPKIPRENGIIKNLIL